MTATQTQPSDSPLKRLMRYLERDPANTSLLADAAAAAYDEDDLAAASDLLDRYSGVQPLPDELVNLAGMVALAQRRFDEAASRFQSLLSAGAQSPALRFNLAWSKAMMGAWQETLDLLDDATVGASARAPALKIHAMHHLDLYDEALREGEELAKRYPENQALMGALATLAMDAEQMVLAQTYARRAPNDPEGQAALGLLALGEHDTARAMPLFDEAIKAQPANARAWVGRGLALLSAGDTKAATAALDKGAELFADHLGSWIASGWAHVVAGDLMGARSRFERARAVDENFAESYGGLAVLDIAAGDLDSARRNSDIALRLDKNCFGGALARSLLLDRSGQSQAAQKIRTIALNTPIGPDGRTIAQALAGFGASRKK